MDIAEQHRDSETISRGRDVLLLNVINVSHDFLAKLDTGYKIALQVQFRSCLMSLIFVQNEIETV